MENNISMQLAKAWTAMKMLLVIWNSDISNKIKCNFFHAVVVSILLYRCTTWTLSVLSKSLTAIAWKCCKLYWTNPGNNIPQSCSYTASHLLPISKTNQDWQLRHTGEIRANSQATLPSGFFYMNKQVLANQLELIYSCYSYV